MGFLLSIKVFPARHAPPVLRKNPMDIAPLLDKCGTRVGIELAQPFQIRQSHVHTSEGCC
jgi:hypothetical protein